MAPLTRSPVPIAVLLTGGCLLVHGRPVLAAQAWAWASLMAGLIGLAVGLYWRPPGLAADSVARARAGAAADVAAKVAAGHGVQARAYRRGPARRVITGLPTNWGRAALLSVAVLVSAIGWTSLCASRALADRIETRAEGIDWPVSAVIEQMPIGGEAAMRVVLLLDSCDAAARQLGCRPGQRVRVSWRAPPIELAPGQRWRLVLRLRRPQTPFNPGLFDAEQRALEDRIAAVGSVRQARMIESSRSIGWYGADTPRIAIETARHRLREQIVAATPELRGEQRGVLLGLIIGDQSAIASGWWDRFNRTGVSHLLSIRCQ